MGKRFAIVIGVAAIGAALMAVGASADFRSVHDPRGDTRCFHENVVHIRPCSASTKRHADIVRATAGHDGTRLRHTIRVVGKFQQAELMISTDSDPECERDVFIERGRGKPGRVRKCPGADPVSGIGRARMDFHRHSVEILFSERSIGNPQSYGWRLFAIDGPTKAYAVDWVPNRRHYIRHRLAQPAAASAGVAQTAAAASAGVVKYDTRLTVTKDRGGNYHGFVYSDRDRNPEYHPAKKVRKCMEGRRVVLFKRRPGPDRRLGAIRSHFGKGHANGQGWWWMRLDRDYGDRVWAKVKPKVRDRYVCRANRSAFRTNPAPLARN